VLEASAGTGKTFTIAGLATRYLAEGVARIDELMLVTFGRAATVELRERVRERLTSAAVALTDPVSARASSDDLLRHLATGTADDVDVRRRRLATAVANFDAATIATTHGFCHQMLAGLGIAADVDHDARFAEATGDLVTEVATDLFVTDHGRADSPPPVVDFVTATSVATRAVGDRSARLEPVDADADSEADIRRAFGERARAVVAMRKRSMHLMDYDDLLVHLRDALTDPETGEDACARIRTRYGIVLVDEFQDTDPVQWEILERAFHGHRTLVLIGDPKQAIYAFRGADVVTYLVAKESAEGEATLGTNWRSDRPLVDALRHVIGDVALGDPRILVHEVDAAHADPTLTGAPVDAPVRLRVVPRSELGIDAHKKIGVGLARPFVAADVAADIVRLLSSAAEIVEDGRPRPVEPGDVAVLVHRNDDGRTVRDALVAVDVPVVLLATTSVFLSSAAADWLILLSALEQPQRPGLARTAALTDFVGWTATDLAISDDTELDGLSGMLRLWATTLADRGVAALLETVVATRGLTERMLSREHGERDLTDLRHVGQALHEVVTEGHGGVASLVEWLQHRIAEAKSDVDEERSRRLESDAKAVQVLTVHRSKGLEYAVVYVPYLWDRWVPGSPDPLRLHDDAGARLLDVGGTGDAGYAARKVVHLREEAGESLRLAYVALTRARSQVVTYWAPASNTPAAPLHRLLFGDRTTGGVLPETVAVPTDDKARQHLTALSERSGGSIVVEPARAGDEVPLTLPVSRMPDLSVRAFDRNLDRAWARTSYSGLTAGLHEAAHGGDVLSEAETPGTVDEPPVLPVSGDGEVDSHLTSPLTDFPGGASFGTLVHGVLENVDFAAADLQQHVTEVCAAQGAERFLARPASELAQALLPSLNTPLGPLAAGRRLADIAPGDRLDELDFELPLAGGDVPRSVVTVAGIVELLRRHLPADDPLVNYANDLTVLASRTLRGFLAGSIDVVLRVSGEDDGDVPRYVVVDYKTNWLGTDDTLTDWHYRPEAMARAMREAHYPLQALLYSVALHRFLRWRQPGYDPATHLGGVLYLFLRGMCGPETPTVADTPHGVFAWTPSPALVTELSDLLRGGDL